MNGWRQSQGFFDNIGNTRRVGAEMGLKGRYGIFGWFLNYSYVGGSYRNGFLVSSPNHPSANANGIIAVNRGDNIPGIPQHSLKFSFDIEVLTGLTFAWDAIYSSGQFLRGDEANLLKQTDDYIVFNLRGE